MYPEITDFDQCTFMVYTDLGLSPASERFLYNAFLHTK